MKFWSLQKDKTKQSRMQRKRDPLHNHHKKKKWKMHGEYPSQVLLRNVSICSICLTIKENKGEK